MTTQCTLSSAVTASGLAEQIDKAMEEMGSDQPEAKDMWLSLHQIIGFAKILEPMSAVAVEHLPSSIRLRSLLDLLAAAVEILPHTDRSNSSHAAFRAELQGVLADIDQYRNIETSRVLALHKIMFGAVAGSLFVHKSLPGDRTGTTALLGNGKFGATYRMRSTEIDEISKPSCFNSFAIREIDVAMAENRGVGAESLHEEVAALMSLAHVNIARCYGSFIAEDGARLSVVMELADGGSIADFIRFTQQPSEVMVAKWATQTASALAYLHAQGLLHNDLRPENMLLTHGKDVKLIHIRFTQQEDESLSQRSYVSPERFSGGAYDGRDDVWALGCVLLELLTSRHLAEEMDQPLCRADLVQVCRGKEALLEAATERSAALGGEVLPLILAVRRQQRASSAQLLQVLTALSAKPVSYPAVRQRLMLKLGANVWMFHLQDVWKCLRICVYGYLVLLLLMSAGSVLSPTKTLTAWGCSAKLQGHYLAELVFPGSADCSSARRDGCLLPAFAEVAAATSGDVQDSALQAVRSAFENTAAVRKRDVESLPSLLYAASSGAQRTGSDLLSAIAMENSCESCLMGDAASVPIYVKLLSVGSDATKEHAAVRLLELTDNASRGNRAAAARAGAFPALSALLESGSPTARESAAGILLHLASEPDEDDTTSPQLWHIVRCRVLATVSDFIAGTAGQAVLQQLGMETLSAGYCGDGRWSWAQIADCVLRWGGHPAAPDSARRRSELVASGLLPRLVSVLSGVCSSDRIQEYVTGVVQALAADAQWKQTLVREPHMVQGLVSILSAASDAARTSAALALWHLAAHSSESQRVLADAGAADALAQAAMSGSGAARSAAHSALKALSVHWGDQLKSVT